MSKRPIIFNLSRLISRRHCPTPTGIDRLELRHARFVLQQLDTRDILFVHQYRNLMIGVDLSFATSVITSLWDVWVEGRSFSKLSRLREVRHFSRLIMYANAPALFGVYIHSSVTRFIQNHPEPIYMNSGHHGANYPEVHHALRTRYKARLLFYLHDLIPIDYPEYDSSNDAVRLHTRRVKMMAQDGALIFVNSEFTRGRFLRFCQHQKLPPPPVEVLHIGVEEQFIHAQPALREQLPTKIKTFIGQLPYFVIVSTIEPRKNHLLLLHIWRALAVTEGEDCPKLLILGKRGWKNEHIINLIEFSPGLQETVLELNNVGDSDLMNLMQNAAACLYPSFVEGWGMPVVESLALGTPCICADIPVLRESGQDQAIYIDPLDGPEWMRVIKLMAKEFQGIPQTDKKTDQYPGFHPPLWSEHIEKLNRALEKVEAEH